MPYQNNNNRLTPKATGITKITPEAQILNKEIKYTFDDTKSKETLALTQGLADLGKGVAGIFDLEQKKHAEDAIEMIYNDDVEGKNRHDWEEAVQRDKTGTLAKYNPYLKENYKKLAAQDFYQQELYELYKDPNYAAMSDKDIYQKIEQSKEHLRKTLLDNGIDTKFAAKYLEDYHTQANEYYGKYLKQSNEREYNLNCNAIANNGAAGLRTRLYNTSLNQQNVEISSALTSLYELHKKEVPIEDFVAKIALPTVLNTIKTYNGTIDREALISAVRDTKFGNYTIADIVPDVEDKLRTSLKSIDEQKYSDELREYQRLERQKKQNSEQAEKEFIQNWTQDPDNFDVEAQAIEIAQKYGVEGDINSLIHVVYQHKQLMRGLNNDDIVENEEVKKALNVKALLGTLTKNDVIDAYENNSINDTSFSKFASHVLALETKQQQAKEKASLNSYKQKASELTQYIKVNKDELSKIKTGNNKNASIDLSETIAAINSQVANEELTPAEGRKALDSLQRQANKQLTAEKKEQLDFYSPMALLDSNYLSKLASLTNNPQYDDTTAVKVFQNMGITASKGDLVLSSGIKTNRKLSIDKEAKDHNGYDFALKEGTPLFAPNVGEVNPLNLFQSGDMEVVFAGKAGSAGNVVMIKFLKTGDFMRVLHMDKVNVKTGQKLRAGACIGTSGNTGRSTGAHAHFDFFNSKGRRAYGEDVMFRLTGTKYKKK